MRRFLIPVVVVALAIAAAAVGGRGEVAAAAPAGCAKANLDLVKDGQLTIGTDNPAFPPWFAGGETKGRPWKINDPAKGQGFEPAVAYAVAKRLGFAKSEVVWVYSPFNKTIAPGNKAFDFAINQVSYTPQRRRRSASAPATTSSTSRSSASRGSRSPRRARSPACKRYKLGAQLGTTSYQYIVRNIRPSQSVAVYDTNDAAVAALKNGQIDGLVVDLPTAFYVTAVQVPNGKIIGQFEAKGTQERFGMVFRKGNPLIACVNNALAQMKRTGC